MVSIIIPVYNVEKYIVDCLDSIKKQVYRDFEIILVNDGSTDKSLEVIQEYINENSINIKVISQKNKGVSAARNRGLEYSKGQLVCFIDADDILDSKYLYTMVSEIEKTKCDLCICEKIDIDEDTHCIDVNNKYNSKIENPINVLEKLLYGKIKVGIWGVLCRRELIGKIRFCEQAAYSEDLEVVWKLIAVSSRIVLVSAKLYGYRLRYGSAMSQISTKRLDGLMLFKNLQYFIDEHISGFSSTYKKFGVAKWLWATLWQEALAANTYNDFIASLNKYGDLSVMRNLLSYPSVKVWASTILFICFPRIYYYMIRMVARNRRKINSKEVYS